MNVFSDHLRKRLSEALGRALVCSCENSALVVAATVDAFNRGQGLHTLMEIVENRRSLCKDSKTFRARLTKITEPAKWDNELFYISLSGFLTYYSTRLPIIVSNMIKYKGRPSVHEASEILKASLVTFEKAHPDVLDGAMRNGLFEDIVSVLRRARKIVKPLRTSDEFVYSSAWLTKIILDTSRLALPDDGDCPCSGLIASCIDVGILNDCKVMAAAALCDIFPMFFNQFFEHYIELLLLSPIASEKPFDD